MNKALIGITGGIVATTIGATALIFQSLAKSSCSAKVIALHDVVLDKGGGFIGIDDKNEAYLAEALKIDLGTLRSAKDTAWQKALQQALHNEMITQAQADMLQEKQTGSRTFGTFSRWMIEGGVEYRTNLAEALRISPDALSHAQRLAEGLRTETLRNDKTTLKTGELSRDDVN